MTDSATSKRKYSFVNKVILLMFAGLTFVLPGCQPSRHRETGGHVIQVYYFPIGAETLTPVTSENIEKRGNQCVIDLKEEIDLIKKLMSSGRPPSPPNEGFSDKVVRVKLIEKTEHGSALLALVENDGYVKWADGRDQVLDSKNLAALKKLIEKHFKQ